MAPAAGTAAVLAAGAATVGGSVDNGPLPAPAERGAELLILTLPIWQAWLACVVGLRMRAYETQKQRRSLPQLGVEYLKKKKKKGVKKKKGGRRGGTSRKKEAKKR